jgi:hypothetical protein
MFVAHIYTGCIVNRYIGVKKNVLHNLFFGEI